MMKAAGAVETARHVVLKKRGRGRGAALLAVLTVLGLGAGCDNDIDPDTLVRELRVLAIRFGDPSPGSQAEVQATVDLSKGSPDLVFTQPTVQVRTLAAAPTGPGRRVATPRKLAYEWWACLGELSLFSPGTLDPDCRKFLPTDPPPAQNPVLRALTGGPTSDPHLTLPTDSLKAILGEFLQVLLSGGGSGGGGSGGGFMLPSRPITLLLPVIVRVSVVGGDPNSQLDSEVAYNFLRIVVALPGMTLPPPNHNPSFPVAGGLLVGSDAMGQMMQPTPCAMADAGDCMVRIPATRTAPLYVIAVAAPGSIETYDPLDDSGRTGVAETMRYSWFSTDGTFNDERTGDAQAQTAWENGTRRPAPDQVSVVDLWVVVQDERGGTDYQRFQLSFP